MLLAIGGLLAACVLSSYLTRTPQQRAEAQARFDRKWNPIVRPLTIGLWIFFLWGYFFHFGQ